MENMQQGHQGTSSSSSREISPSCSPGTMTTMNAPRYGTTVPNRIFVGGITTDTTEQELQVLFSRFGKVSAVKIINDRAGVPRGYGFVTFETDDEAKRVLRDGDNLILKGRKLNVAIAIKKQPLGRSIDSTHFLPNGTMMFQQPGGLAFPAYPFSDAPHFYSPESLYQFNLNAGHTGNGSHLNQVPNSPRSGPGHASYPTVFYQQPMYFTQPQVLPNGYPSHFQAAPNNPGAAMPGAAWPHYLMPQVMVNSQHMNHV